MMKNNFKSTPYELLTTQLVNIMSADEAELELAYLISQKGRIRGNGKILAFSEFNEDPDLLINQLLAKILVSKIKLINLQIHKTGEIAVLSIENSAAYLASEIAHELETVFHLQRPPRIIRARKTPDGNPPSPAMGEIQSVANVVPITSNNVSRHLIASVPDPGELTQVRNLVVVDDFRATGDTLRGGIEIGINLLLQSHVPADQIKIIPIAGLGKPKQEKESSYNYKNIGITDVITAINVDFKPDSQTKLTSLTVNGFTPMIMEKVPPINN
jgi:adenine/guanine phosphoribosyltransferase-like PRPP-binding protein